MTDKSLEQRVADVEARLDMISPSSRQAIERAASAKREGPSFLAEGDRQDLALTRNAAEAAVRDAEAEAQRAADRAREQAASIAAAADAREAEIRARVVDAEPKPEPTPDPVMDVIDPEGERHDLVDETEGDPDNR